MRATCRAMAVQGDVRAEPPGEPSGPLELQERVRGDDWISLAAGGRLVVREPRTARETTLRGPGRARLCVDSQEEAWLLAGDFESTPGSGESPGAEQWIVTTLGVVRYAAAKVVVGVSPAGTSISVADGAAFAWPTDDASVAPPPAPDAGPPSPAAPDGEGWLRVTGGRVLLATKAPNNPRDLARSVAARCSELAGRAHDLAAALLKQPGAAQAAEQVRTRRLARAACAVAHLRTSPPGAQGVDVGADLMETLRQADSAWRELPAVDTAQTGGPATPGGSD
jgi:hypothetical protein